MFTEAIVVPESSSDYILTNEERSRTLFQARGPLGHELLVIDGGHAYLKRRILLVKGDEVKMYIWLDQSTGRPGKSTGPLISFLQQAFIRDFWASPDNRVFHDMPNSRFARLRWSDLMRDCNSIGYWLNGCQPTHDINNDDIEQQYYSPRVQDVTFGEQVPNDMLPTAVYLRFLCRKAQAIREVGLEDLDKDLEHLMVPQGYTADVVNQKSYIQQTVFLHRIRGKDVYMFVARNELPPEADPLTVNFTADTTFTLKRIEKGAAEAFQQRQAAKQRNVDWANVTVPKVD